MDLPESAVARTPALRTFERGLSWFLPDELLLDPERARQARLVVASALTLAIIESLVLLMIPWRPYVLVGGVALPRPTAAVILLAVIAHVATAFVVRGSGRSGSAASLLVATLGVVFGTLAWQSGGFDSPMVWWMTAVPMLSSFVAGPRATVVTSLAVIFVLFGFYAADASLASGPPGVHAKAALPALRAQVILLAFVTFFGWYYEQTRRASAREVVAAYNDLERTNAALRMSQLHVRQIAENVGQALWLHDLRTDRVVYANAAFAEVFRLPRQELAVDAFAWRSRVHADDEALAPGASHAGDREYRLVVDGHTRWVRHSVYLVGDEATPTHRAVHLVADVTLLRTANALRERYLETVLQVQENERRHLARELHDETGQSLTALLVGLRALANAEKDPELHQLVADMSEQLRIVVGDLGRLARGLHPSALDELGLVAAVNRLIDDARAVHGLDVRLEVTGREHEHALTGTERLTMYRIVQEALTNVARHAEAKRVDVSLTIEAHVVSVRVEDDGRGFDVRAPPKRHELSTGLGLVSMQERAALSGGEVTMESAPGRGTTVYGTLPTGRTRAPEAPAPGA